MFKVLVIHLQDEYIPDVETDDVIEVSIAVVEALSDELVVDELVVDELVPEIGGKC